MENQKIKTLEEVMRDIRTIEGIQMEELEESIQLAFGNYEFNGNRNLSIDISRTEIIDCPIIINAQIESYNSPIIEIECDYKLKFDRNSRSQKEIVSVDSVVCIEQ